MPFLDLSLLLFQGEQRERKYGADTMNNENKTMCEDAPLEQDLDPLSTKGKFKLSVNSTKVLCDSVLIDCFGTEHLVLLGHRNKKVVAAVNLSSEYFEYLVIL